MSSPAHPDRALLLLVGDGAGLGTAIAQTFMNAGYQVAGVSRGSEGPSEPETVPGFRHYACNVANGEQVHDCVRRVAKDLRPPDVIIYNPMQLLNKSFMEYSVEEFESVWRISCLGAVFVAQAALPTMLEAGRGTLIFTGATASIRGSAGFASLAVAKFGLRGLAQSLAREFGPAGIHVVHTIIDGLIWSPQTVARFNPAQDTCMVAKDIAHAYLHLAQQPRSSWTHELDLRPSDGKF